MDTTSWRAKLRVCTACVSCLTSLQKCVSTSKVCMCYFPLLFATVTDSVMKEAREGLLSVRLPAYHDLLMMSEGMDKLIIQVLEV